MAGAFLIARHTHSGLTDCTPEFIKRILPQPCISLPPPAPVKPWSRAGPSLATWTTWPSFNKQGGQNYIQLLLPRGMRSVGERGCIPAGRKLWWWSCPTKARQPLSLQLKLRHSRRSWGSVEEAAGPRICIPEVPRGARHPCPGCSTLHQPTATSQAPKHGCHAMAWSAMEVSRSSGHCPSRLLFLDLKAGLIAKGASPELTLQAIVVIPQGSRKY